MSAPLFGTDGMRGRAGEEPLTESTLVRLGKVLATRIGGGRTRSILIGHDGRASGETLAAALVRGIVSAGLDADVVGLCPTPAVAYLTRHGPYAAGIVVSASHNPACDNGVKLLGADGAKLPNEIERALEQELIAKDPPSDAAVPGEARRRRGLLGDYVGWLRSEAFPELDLGGWKVALDCANGAYSLLGPRILHAFGADVRAIHDRPDGRNINLDCGALHPEALARATRDSGATIGLSVDGDGDRGMLADSEGRVLDGDVLLAGLGPLLAAEEELPERTVVATVMSNLALEQWLRKEGIALHRTAVGDRSVAAAMREHGWRLGGEKSGHLLFGPEHDYRGDGMYTLLRCAQALSKQGIEAKDFARGYRDFPQELVNLPVKERRPLERIPELAAAVEELERELAGEGRCVVRFSGTELKLRLMVEARRPATVHAALERLRAAAEAADILA